MLSLDELNDAQRRAVVHDPSIPLQILAGPGSGKTKALTCRVAYLVEHHKLLPKEICAVTFTNKAANEMKERLSRLIGEGQAKKLVMGTFHSLCARFLRRWGNLIDLKDNFSICDAEESKKIINKILKPILGELVGRDIDANDGAVASAISNAKSKNTSPEEMGRRIRQGRQPPDERQIIIHQVYSEYEEHLRRTNSLDFDDLLIFGVRLFERNPTLSAWCRHVLVDEFQDTNPIQYRLMVILAGTNRCVTIVGDPDQSIYGWRSADVENLRFMKRDFPTTQQIFLEQNYRSTASILELSLRIVSQDQKRVPKTLLPSHHQGHAPLLRSFPDEVLESEFIAQEILRLKSHTGGLLDFKDFAILLRFNALSRGLEQALQRQGIPVRLLGGQKFFERTEVKDLISYLVLIDNPSFESSFVRAINTPSRQIGEKSVAQVLQSSLARSISPLDFVIGVYNGTYPDIKPPLRRKLGQFVPVMLQIRKMVSQSQAITEVIKYLVEAIEYEAHLKKTQKEWEARWENVQELINFAARFAPHADDPNNNILRNFLETCTLSVEVQTQNDHTDPNSVTITTCHAAKGLEWPVVYVPAVEKGVYPFSRSDDKDEERRLLYVACTRAQAFLGITYCASRMAAGEKSSRELSEFIRAVKTDTQGKRLFSDQSPYFSLANLAETARIIGRIAPDESVVLKHRREFDQNRWGTALYDEEMEDDEEMQEYPATFTSARAVPRLTPGTVKVAVVAGAPPATARVTVPQPRPIENVQLPSSPVQLESQSSLHSDPIEPHSWSPMPVPIASLSSPLRDNTRQQEVLLPTVEARPQRQPLAPRPTHQTSASLPETQGNPKPQTAGVKLASGTKRLGMGRMRIGYQANKKQKIA